MSQEFPVSEFPKLMWSPKGQEVTVADYETQQRRAAEGYRLTAELPAEVPAPEPEPVVVPDLADGVLVPDAEVPPPDAENEPATFGAPDDASYGDDAQIEDDKPKKGGKKK